MTGSTHASHCVTQPTYATVTKNYYAHKSMRHRNIPSDFQKFAEYISKFPEFSRVKKIPEFSRFSRVVSTLQQLSLSLPSSEVIYLSLLL